LEEREAEERRSGDSQLGPAGERSQRGLQDDDPGEECGADGRGRRAVDDRAIDQQIDVVEPVSEHRDRDGDRDDLHRGDEEELADLSLLLQSAAGEETDDQNAAAECERLDLLSLHTS
jgi:hypothetical protein